MSFRETKFLGHYIIRIREDDYFNAVDICKIGSKNINNYLQSDNTIEFTYMLKANVNKSVIEKEENDEIWIHPKLAIHLAFWIGPIFSIEIINLVDRFTKGDTTLVAEVIKNHDIVNETKTDILLVTKENYIIENLMEEINDYKKKLLESNKYINKYKDENDILKENRCKLCNKKYSYRSYFDKHINTVCKYKDCIIIDLDIFKKYIKLLEEYLEDLYDKEDILYYISCYNWDSDNPTVKLINFLGKNKEKEYKFDIKNNDGRWRLIRELVDRELNIPIYNLLDKTCSEFIQINKNDLFILINAMNRRDDYLLVKELKDLVY